MSMRVSTRSMFDLTPRAIGRQQYALSKTQAMISSGKRIQTPSDDPSGAARALDLRYSSQQLEQLSQNQTMAKNRLDQSESAIASATDILQGVIEKAIEAYNDSLSSADLHSIATQLRGSLQELAGVANSTDSDGNYIFSGFATDSKPFVAVGSTFQYQGDSDRREAQVGFQRKLQVNDPGNTVFEGALSGNGVFSASANKANTGTLTLKSATVQDNTKATKHGYSIHFCDSSGTMRFSVLDTTTGKYVLTNSVYTEGQSIQFDGIQVTVSGTPSRDDKITITPSSERSLFDTINELASALEKPVANPSDRAKLKNELFRLQADLSQGLDQLSNARSRIGSRLTELDTYSSIIDESKSMAALDLANTEDLDYASAVSQLNMQKSVFEAAQISYTKMTSSNLFDLMR